MSLLQYSDKFTFTALFYQPREHRWKDPQSLFDGSPKGLFKIPA